MNLGLGLAPVAGSERGARSVPKPLREEPQCAPPLVPWGMLFWAWQGSLTPVPPGGQEALRAISKGKLGTKWVLLPAPALGRPGKSVLHGEEVHFLLGEKSWDLVDSRLWDRNWGMSLDSEKQGTRWRGWGMMLLVVTHLPSGCQNQSWWVYWFYTAVTNYHKLSGLTQYQLITISYSFRNQKSEMGIIGEHQGVRGLCHSWRL